MYYYLVRNKLSGEYRTINIRDVEDFKRLDKFFGLKDENENYVFNFEIIDDIEEIKNILDEKFTSKNRGEEYNVNLPSVTQIAYTLKPIDIQNEKFLLKYLNNTPLKEVEWGTDRRLNLGTLVHFILQQYICDTEKRKKDKPLIEKLKYHKDNKKYSNRIKNHIENNIIQDLKKYIQDAYVDNEIIRKVVNLEELKEEFENIVYKCVPNFIMNELIFNDLCYSEIFLSVDNYIQGSIDFVSFENGVYKIIDYKTTTSEKDGKYKFKTPREAQCYARQLAIYYELLKKSNMCNIMNDKNPEFYIYQIHLLANKYKKFKIEYETIESAKEEVENVLNWYWDIRNGTLTEYPQIEEDELDFISL